MADGFIPDIHDEDAPVFVISVAATLAGMHPQTLRQYDRIGLVSPGRTSGRGRRYSARDIAMLREVQRLSQDEGINLAGVKRILELELQVEALQQRVRELQAELENFARDATLRERALHKSYRRDLVPIDQGAVVVWQAGHNTPTTPR
ncbi:MAG: helix-turn-helix transcriptional regulator [Frankiaceae bacterium]|nr:helix-turn-helix transcriptional regulator [Frankiaceae bacterium]MBV9872124.1 helix-turn-helix transcriptional regulator [Frankiaceae bacterium]